MVPETPVLATSPYQAMIDELNNSLHAEDSVEGMQNRLAAIASVLSNWGVSTVSHRKVQLDVATSVVKKMIGRRGNKLYQVGSRTPSRATLLTAQVPEDVISQLLSEHAQTSCRSLWSACCQLSDINV